MIKILIFILIQICLSPKLLLSHPISHYKSLPRWKANLSRFTLLFLFILLNSQGILEKGIFRRHY